MPAKALTSGAGVRCTFGVAPSIFNALPVPGKPTVNGLPVGLVTDTTMVNIPTFGMCTTQTNPLVALATSTALGVPTPAPCVPVLAMWLPGSPVTATGVPIATVASTCLCMYGGSVSVELSPNLILDV